MGSIRPLVTITILAVVGAYLYVKINEGPVPSRASTNSSIDSPVGVPPLTNTQGASLAAESGAPAWPTTATTTTPAPTSSAPAATTVNPPASASPATATTSKDKTPVVPAIPELPPLPVLSEVASSTTQPSPPLPKDPPPNQTSATAASKDAPVQQPAPLTTTTDPGKASPLPAAPQTSATQPPTTPPAQTAAQNPLRTTPPATTAPDPTDRYASAAPSTSTPAPPITPTTSEVAPPAITFSASWPAIQAALDRRDLKQAHQLLSKWHGSESLNPTDTEKVETLLSQLAGTVIYSTEHQLEPARIVKPGETLDAIAKEYNVPSELLAKINGIQSSSQLQPGQQLKVVRGPFAATVDLRRNELTLTVDDRYAGKFHLTIPPGVTLTDGQWVVDQKLTGSTSTANPSAYATTPIPADRTIILRNAAATSAGAPTLIIGSGPTPAGLAASPPSIRVSPQDAEEISDILSVGSRVVVRK